jgi:hypothetical protein
MGAPWQVPRGSHGRRDLPRWATGLSPQTISQRVPAGSLKLPSFRETAPADAPCLSDLSDSALQDSAGWAVRYKSVLERHRPQVVQFFSPAIVHSLSGETLYQTSPWRSNILPRWHKSVVQEGMEALDAG